VVDDASGSVSIRVHDDHKSIHSHGVLGLYRKESMMTTFSLVTDFGMHRFCCYIINININMMDPALHPPSRLFD
jgi:hypothetical protein